jgi:hypothetical protein
VPKKLPPGSTACWLRVCCGAEAGYGHKVANAAQEHLLVLVHTHPQHSDLMHDAKALALAPRAGVGLGR